MLRILFALSALATGAGAAAIAASPPGGGTGKVSVQDIHFTTRKEAATHCDASVVRAAADGSFVCSADDAARMPNNKHPDLMKRSEDPK